MPSDECHGGWMKDMLEQQASSAQEMVLCGGGLAGLRQDAIPRLCMSEC